MKKNRIEKQLPKEFYSFLKRIDPNEDLVRHFRQISTRRRLDEIRGQKGKVELPTWLERQPANTDKWKAQIPAWMMDQRNQMTGPADNEKLTVQLINSGSPGVMLDIEDSMANTPKNLLKAHRNVKEALKGELYYYKSIGKNDIPVQVRANPKKHNTVVFLRVRGLHLTQICPGLDREEPTSASLFDLAMHFHDLNLEELPHDPCIYIPKSESAAEALWWKEAFGNIEKAKGWKTGTIKCMALVESHPLAYEMEEFAYNLQPYLVGLNLGRWDYMASLINYMYTEKGWLFPDRNEIPSDIPFFQNLRHWMAHVCHKHGMLAIGGMSAMYPDRKNPERNEIAQAKLKADKENEAACLMDGAWTGHPDQNKIAVEAFPHPNQLDKMPGLTELPDLREFDNTYPVTKEGTMAALRTCVLYRDAVLSGKGAKLIDGFMEDLATDRIYRIMVCQRLDRGVHTQEEIDEMLGDLSLEGDKAWDDAVIEVGRLIETRQFNPR
jgi:malate synthase